MNQRVRELKNFFTTKRHHAERVSYDANLADEFSKEGLSLPQRVVERFARLLKAERPLIFPGERIAFTRTVKNIPPILTDEEFESIKSCHFLHEAGFVCNICPAYEDVIRGGLAPLRQKCAASEQTEYYKAAIISIDAVLSFVKRYRDEAERLGYGELSDILTRVPLHGARTFHEALQSFRILHFMLWLEGEYHNIIGRFDQFMYPYFKADLDSGRLSKEEAYELLTEFFLSFNKDSDLYMGVQQGDNGQSLVLGGMKPDGSDGFNELSELCLMASKDLMLIDPKINMRVSGNTPFAQFELGTQLTKDGLGFPQYENDDIVIPGLVSKGYEEQDARNYVVAACWEFIIPGCGMDIPNIGAMSYPKALQKCVEKHLATSLDFAEFMAFVRAEIQAECDRIILSVKDMWMLPAPFMSLLMRGCIENGRDISGGAKYNNYGIHGTGLSTAVDSLFAIKRYIFDERSLTADTLIRALSANYENHDELLHRLRYETPKMGMNDDEVDGIACDLMRYFSGALDGKANERGGCFRAGTGSAMYYLWHSGEVGASADGRRAGEAFGCNYSPSLYARIDSPLSIIRSFTKPDLKKIINGGPLTMELHSSIFADGDGVLKVATLVKRFIELGGHQLQLNAINRDKLLMAQRHPEDFKNLIVRVWGWSAYFVELDKGYQDHVISRQEYMS